jgi:hypothetical protein
VLLLCGRVSSHSVSTATSLAAQRLMTWLARIVCCTCCCCCCPAEGKKEAVDSEHGAQQLVWHLNVRRNAAAQCRSSGSCRGSNTPGQCSVSKNTRSALWCARTSAVMQAAASPSKRQQAAVLCY